MRADTTPYFPRFRRAFLSASVGGPSRVDNRTKAAVKAVRVAKVASRAAVSRSRVSRSRSPDKAASRVVRADNARVASRVADFFALKLVAPGHCRGFFLPRWER
jgi:hypothetical protein